MHFIYLYAAGLVAGSAALPAHVRRGVDCAFSTSADSGATCESLSSNWGLSVDDFRSLNPGLDCPELNPNDSYCVVGTVNDDPPTTASTSLNTSIPPATTGNTVPTTIQLQSSTKLESSAKPSSTVASSSSTISAGNGIATPQPTQPGMVTNCNKFHYISQSVTCSQVLSYEVISLADFVRWNPTVKADCSGMWAGVNVCVGIAGSVTEVPSSTTASAATTTSAGNGIRTPTPIQPNMVSNCAKFHWVDKGVTCSQILSYNKITLASFYAWNPSVKADCSGMWSQVHVCVGSIESGPTIQPSATIVPTTTTSTNNGVTTPTPIQPGMVPNCRKFHYASEGNTCSQIASYNRISLADFFKWNTGIGTSCKNMWQDTWVCVGI